MSEEIFPPSPALVVWLKEHAIPFSSTQPGNGFTDLQPLKQIIGDARIVALGEGTHGTHEFFTMKHRLLEFLVKEMGFTLFAIEAAWAEANLINEYVHTGKGDPAQLLAGLCFWTWNTQEVLDMILWMRAYNEQEGNTRKVSFFGCDMQAFHIAMDNVLAYLQKVDPEKVATVEALYATWRSYRSRIHEYDDEPPLVRAQCRENLQRVYDILLMHRFTYEALSSSEEYALARQSARVVLQSEEVFSADDYAKRDRYMAENVSWLLEQAGADAKIVLWAHNGHVSTDAYHYGYKSMGSYLRERYREKMLVWGFCFYQGSFNAIDIDRHKLLAHRAALPPGNSYEHLFHQAGLPCMFLDLRTVKAGSSVTDWLSGPHSLRSVGAGYADSWPEHCFYSSRLPNEFDGIIYLQDTTPSRLLSSNGGAVKRSEPLL